MLFLITLKLSSEKFYFDLGSSFANVLKDKLCCWPQLLNYLPSRHSQLKSPDATTQREAAETA